MRAERDIALCAVTDTAAKSKIMNALIQKRIPYAEEWHKVPMLMRKKYEGVKEVCIVITHGEKAEEAKTVIADLGNEVGGMVHYDIKGLV